MMKILKALWKFLKGLISKKKVAPAKAPESIPDKIEPKA